MMNDRPPYLKRLTSTAGSVNPWFHYRYDEVELPDGSRTTYAYHDHPRSVVVVPVTREGQVVLIRQYRYAVNEWCFEVPAGGIHDEEPAEAARRELLEEAGGTAELLQFAGNFYGMPGASNVEFFIFLATGVTLGASSPEPTEDLEVLLSPIPAALDMARTGIISDAPSALALFRCAALLRLEGK